MADKTIRGVYTETSPFWRETDWNGRIYVGPDHCTMEGASALCGRLSRYWANRGEHKEFQVYVAVPSYHHTGSIYGVREKRSLPKRVALAIVPQVVRKLEVGPTPRQRIKKLIRDVVRQYPGVTYEEVVNRVPEQRLGRGKVRLAVSAVRRHAAQVVKAAFPQLSTPQLGAIFNVDHTTAVYYMNPEWREKHNLEGRQRYAARAAA